VVKKRQVDDQEAAAYLTYWAVIEIRHMARRRKPLSSWPDDDYVACVAWLADLVHNIAGGVRRRPRWPPWRKRKSPFHWTWKMAGPAGREWILTSLDRAGLQWTPPPLDEPGGSVTGQTDIHA
jgi:hypothetical protein